MSLRTCLLGFAGVAALMLAGCGPNKGAEKGTDDNLNIATKAGAVESRPAIPSKAAAKTDGKTIPKTGGNPASKGPPPIRK